MAKTFSLDINQHDMDRVIKRLDQWQGKPLEVRMAKATSAGMSLMVGPIRALTPVSPDGQRGRYPHVRGNLRRKTRMRTLPTRRGEVAAAYAGPAVYYGQWVQHGTKEGQRPQPYVALALNYNRERVVAFIDEQVRRLA
jgi:hypothetical protein